VHFILAREIGSARATHLRVRAVGPAAGAPWSTGCERRAWGATRAPCVSDGGVADGGGLQDRIGDRRGGEWRRDCNGRWQQRRGRPRRPCWRRWLRILGETPAGRSDRSHGHRRSPVRRSHARRIARSVQRRDGAPAGVARRVVSVATSALGAGDRVTQALLLGQIDEDLSRGVATWMNGRSTRVMGPQVSYLRLAELQPVTTLAQGQALVARWRTMGPTIDSKDRQPAPGAGAGKVATRDEVQRTLQQLDTMLAAPDAAWVLGGPATVAHSDWPRAGAGWVRGRHRPGNHHGPAARPSGVYRDVIRNEILPRARDQAHVGLTNVPGGDDCLPAIDQVHTSLELRRPRSPLWSGRSGPHPRRDRARGRRRPRHPRLRRDPASAARRSGPAFFHARRESKNSARAAWPARPAAEPVFLRRSPRTSCVVKPISPYEEKDSTIAYYQPAAVDGTRPGRIT